MKTIASVVLCIGLAAIGVIAWAVRKLALAGRPLDPGDGVFFAVLGVFGAFCLFLAWQFFRDPGTGLPSAKREPSPKRVGVSRAFAAAGVGLLVASVVIPETWYPVVPLFTGLAFLCVSHILTPCVERLEQLRKARASLHQL